LPATGTAGLDEEMVRAYIRNQEPGEIKKKRTRIAQLPFGGTFSRIGFIAIATA
jgi:hypothetical protein